MQLLLLLTSLVLALASQDYPKDSLSCYSTLLAPRTTQYNTLICPEFANKWCVKVKVDIQSQEYCGKTFFGDSWWGERQECVYKKCSSECSPGMTAVPAMGNVPAHNRETFCCGPENPDKTEGNLCNGAGRLGLGIWLMVIVVVATVMMAV